MADALPIRLLKRLANAGPVSLLDVDDIECSCVLLAARLVHAESPFGISLRQDMLVAPMTVWGLTPSGVNLALSGVNSHQVQRSSNNVGPEVAPHKSQLSAAAPHETR